MTKNKKVIALGIILMFMLLFTTKVNAEETFSTNDGIVASKIVEGVNGHIELNFTNIPLSTESTYEWGLGKTSLKEEITKWYSLSDFNGKNKTAKINLLATEEDILKILKTTDIAYIYIKDTKENRFIVDALRIDLTLPPYHTFDLIENYGNYYFIGNATASGNFPEYGGAIYGIENVCYKFVKVTNENQIHKYNQAIDNNTSIEDVFSIKVNDIEKLTDWQQCVEAATFGPYSKILKENVPKDNGLYILYMKAKDSDSKTIYGYRTWPSGLKKVPIGNNTNTGNNGSNGNTGITSANKGKVDTTTAKQILPSAGITSIIIFIIMGVVGIGSILYIKYKNIPLK